MKIEQNRNFGVFYFKAGLLLFWFAWFALAFLSNLFDLLHEHNVLMNVKFQSGNYQALEKVISIYASPKIILNILFYLDLMMEFIITFLFLLAFYFFFNKKRYHWKFIHLAFMLSIALWWIFILMEEIFIAYSYESTHIRLCIFEILSLFVFHLIPWQNEK